MYAKSSTFQHELLVHKQASYYNLYEFTLMKSHSSIVSGFNCRLYRKQGVKICEYPKQCQWFVFTGWSTDRGTDCWWVHIMCCSFFLIFSPWWFGVHSWVELYLWANNAAKVHQKGLKDKKRGRPWPTLWIACPIFFPYSFLPLQKVTFFQSRLLWLPEWKKICIGNSMICSDIWHKYREWYFETVIRNFTSC